MYIRDFAVFTDLAEDFSRATLRIRPFIGRETPVDLTGWTLEADLYTPDDMPVLPRFASIPANEVANEKYQKNFALAKYLTAEVDQPSLWSAETPHLYKVVLTLKDGQGSTVEARSTRIGFRKVETRGGELYINGKREYVYGVNRHEHDAWQGKTVSRERMEQDVILMKQFGFNSVRTSHYPNDPYFYDLCDRYGLYVMDEANVETCGADAELSNNPMWLYAQLDRVAGMVQRDINHPSIIFWSLGNESGVGSNHAARAAWVKDYDPTRLVHFEAYMHNGGSRQYGYGIDFMKTNRPAVNPHEPPAVDVVSTMYPSVEGVVRLATETDETRPVLMCEYAHAKGNALGNHREYWEAVKKYPRLIGGYIWDWVDQSIIQHDTLTGQEYFSSINGTNGLVFADRTVKPAIYECKKIYQRIRFDYVQERLTIHNEYNYLPLDTFRFAWKLMRDGKVIQHGVLPDIHALPGDSMTVQLPVKWQRQPGEIVLEVNATLKADASWAPAGFEVAWEQFILNSIPKAMKLEKGHPLTYTDDGQSLCIRNETFSMTFDHTTGQLQNWQVGGHELLAEKLQLNLWRAPTQNDGGYKPEGNEISRQWVASGLDSLQHRLISFQTSKADNGCVEISTKHRAQKPGSASYVDYNTAYRIAPSGTLHVAIWLKPSSDIASFPRVGYTLTMPSGYEHFAWYGYGPMESYNDRHEGTRLGMFHTTVDSLFTHHTYPQENGNHYRCTWVSLTDNVGNGLMAEGDPHIQSSAMHYTLENLSEATNDNQLIRTNDITWNIDFQTYPIGNRSCGPPPLDKYVLHACPMEFGFTLRPITASERQ